MKDFHKFINENKESDEDENIVYFFGQNRYHSITTGEVKKVSDNYLTILSGRTEIKCWIGICTNTFDEAKKLKKILDDVNWWDKVISNTSPNEYDNLMKEIMQKRHQDKIEDVKIK